MNRLTIALTASLTLIATGCASFQRPTSTPINTPPPTALSDNMQPVEPERQTFIQRELEKGIGILRADIQNSLEAATLGGDEQGRQCHVAGLAWLDSLRMTHVRFTGIVSIAEDVRLKQLAARRSEPLWNDVEDKCANIYPVATAARQVRALMRGGR